MGTAFSIVGIIFGAAGLLLAWVKLRPSERRLAMRISQRAWRIGSALALLAFFLWSNYYFLAFDGPITRFQVVLLVVVYVEVVALGVLFLFDRLLDRVTFIGERLANPGQT